MDFDSISRFVEVVDNGSFAAAARLLDITPQALSTSIAKLEKSLGVTLFDRERGGITRPTEFGNAFLPHARFMMAAERRALEEVHARRDARSGWVRLGVGESIAGAPIARAIARLRAVATDARIAVVEGYTHDLLTRLDAGEFDLIAGAPDSARTQRHNLVQTPLYASRDLIIARHEHPLAGKSNVTLEDMQDFPWMLSHTRRDSFEVTVATYVKQGLRPPRHILYSDSASVGLELLANDDYLLFVSRDICWPRLGTEHAPFVLIDAPEPTVERHACLLYRSDYPLSAMAEQLRDHILAELRTGEAKPAPRSRQSEPKGKRGRAKVA